MNEQDLSQEEREELEQIRRLFAGMKKEDEELKQISDPEERLLRQFANTMNRLGVTGQAPSRVTNPVTTVVVTPPWWKRAARAVWNKLTGSADSS